VLESSWHKPQACEESTRTGARILGALVTSLLGLGCMVEASKATSFCNTNGCTVSPVPGPGFGGPGAGSGGGWGGGSSTGSPTPDPAPSCQYLQNSKPPSCPNPIPFPKGYDYGRDSLPSGGGILHLLFFIERQPHVSPDARALAKGALSTQTRSFATRVVSSKDTMATMQRMIAMACEKQHQYDKGSMLMGNISKAELKCLQALDRISAESNGTMNISEWFIQWTKKEGLDLSDLGIPSTFINWLSPGNSVRSRYEKITSDAICSTWWKDVEQQKCNVPR